jgi:hypothetical protein
MIIEIIIAISIPIKVAKTGNAVTFQISVV